MPPKQKVLADLEKQEAHISHVLTKQEELYSQTGSDPLPGAQALADQLQQLKDQAVKHRDELEQALNQQNAYEEEVQDLYQNISQAQQKLQETPVVASSVQGLQQQIADHNVRGSSGWLIIMCCLKYFDDIYT